MYRYRKWKTGLRILFFVGVGMVFFSLVSAEQKSVAAASRLSQEVLRFHVRAEDDSCYAQELKEKVRDGVLLAAKEWLNSTQNKEEAIFLIRNHWNDIREKAEEITSQEGRGEGIALSLKKEWFPVRAYGNVIFPAGFYDSLSIEIGAGKGHNWWCVMYPTLCFQDYEKGTVTKESEERLEQIVPETTIGEKKKADSPLQIRFLLFPFLNRFFSSDTR